MVSEQNEFLVFMTWWRRRDHEYLKCSSSRCRAQNKHYSPTLRTRNPPQQQQQQQQLNKHSVSLGTLSDIPSGGSGLVSQWHNSPAQRYYISAVAVGRLHVAQVRSKRVNPPWCSGALSTPKFIITPEFLPFLRRPKTYSANQTHTGATANYSPL